MTTVEMIRQMGLLAGHHGARVFTLRDMCCLAGETRAATAMTLTRAARQGLVARTGNVWLNLLDPPDVLEVALALESPSYLSFESALYHAGILAQSPRGALTMATTRRPRLVRTAVGDIGYRHLSPERFFGYDERRIALPEKAWLDLCYIRSLAGRSSITEDMDLSGLDRPLLRRLARLFPGARI